MTLSSTLKPSMRCPGSTGPTEDSTRVLTPEITAQWGCDFPHGTTLLGLEGRY
jgi:hypothetical protein